MHEEYTVNKDFQEYVDKYCKGYHKSVEEALEHAIVVEVGKQYREQRLTIVEVENEIKRD